VFALQGRLRPRRPWHQKGQGSPKKQRAARAIHHKPVTFYRSDPKGSIDNPKKPDGTSRETVATVVSDRLNATPLSECSRALGVLMVVLARIIHERR
jgi:hypothetical protein